MRAKAAAALAISMEFEIKFQKYLFFRNISRFACSSQLERE